MAPSGRVRWSAIADPTAQGAPTRAQVPSSTPFRNGEGIWYWRGVCYFTTKTDKKVWAYDVRKNLIDVLYDRALAQDASLDAVDNVTIAPTGDVLVCEDGGNMEIGIISPERAVAPLVRLVGEGQSQSEICGVVFDPSGKRMYFTSQRESQVPGMPGPGAVYEVTGPFRIPRGGVPRDFAYGPPAGEARPSGPLNPGGDDGRPAVRAGAAKAVGRSPLVRKGLAVRVDTDEAATVSITLDSLDLARTKGKGGLDPPAEAGQAGHRGGRDRARRRAGRDADEARPARPQGAGPAPEEASYAAAGERPRRRRQRAHDRAYGQGGGGAQAASPQEAPLKREDAALCRVSAWRPRSSACPWSACARATTPMPTSR